jgi:BirA family biotin operon repressor/biotin-[acetyl-CoA-carboxylase] ligase
VSATAFRVLRHDSLGSTNEHALAEIAAGRARHGDVHVAAAQSAGRGRLGRVWHGAPGEGLYLTVVWLPVRPLHAAGLTMASGLAVRDAAAALGARGALLKWPNDLVVPGAAGAAKLAGVLIESRGLGVERPHYAIGIGLNVLQRRFPAELTAERPVASLALLGSSASVDLALSRVLGALATRLAELTAAPQTTADAFAAATGLAGKRVRARCGPAEHAGVLERIAAWSGLRLRGEGGVQTLALEHVAALEAF